MMDVEARNDMVMANLPLAFAAAKPYCRGKDGDPAHLAQWGTLGLIDAAERFDGRVKFSTYAMHRIRGAILDGLRRESWFGRNQKDPQRVRAWPLSLDVPYTDEDGNECTYGELLPGGTEPEEELAPLWAAEEARQLVAEGMAVLSDRERLVVALYYFEGWRLWKVGLLLEVSESRVCQIHHDALRKMRRALAPNVTPEKGAA